MYLCLFVFVYLQRSIDLNPAQKDLVLKVAELLVSSNECDSRAEFWVEKAGKLQPGNPAVFNLKVRLQFFLHHHLDLSHFFGKIFDFSLN